MLSVGALAASSSSRMLRFDSLARKLKLASARPLGAPYVGPGLRQPERASREREREQCTLIRGKRYPHPPPRLHPLLTCRRLASALADPLSPAPRRGAALLPRVGERFENYTQIWQND